jgi:hypothetical protein
MNNYHLICSQEPPERLLALANNVLWVLPASSDKLPLQSSDKLCHVNMVILRDCEVWLTDHIRTVMMAKCLIQ